MARAPARTFQAVLLLLLEELELAVLEVCVTPNATDGKMASLRSPLRSVSLTPGWTPARLPWRLSEMASLTPYAAFPSSAGKEKPDEVLLDWGVMPFGGCVVVVLE